MTLLAVTVAFTVFGLMIGLSATIDRVEQRARADRIFSSARFGYIERHAHRGGAPDRAPCQG